MLSKCKNMLYKTNSEQKKNIDRQKFEEIRQKILLRDFKFEESIKGDMNLISNYKDPETIKKILEIVPKCKEN